MLKHNHSEPDAQADTHSVSGGMNHSITLGFNWEKATKRALEKKLYRAIHLARTNLDYQITYPSECRENSEKKILSCCHPEAKKRITHDHLKILQLSVVPAVDRPKRMNRNG